MKRLSIFLVALLIVAVAVFAAVAVDGNKAAAFSTGWAGGCATCHATGAGTGIHVAADYPTHGSSSCFVCHVTIGDTPALATCVVCHGSAETISVANGTHSSSGCASLACHGVAQSTTTTTQSTTTTTQSTTTSTTSGTTSTTLDTTSTTSGTTSTTLDTTSTTAAPTTTTTVPTGSPSFTG